MTIVAKGDFDVTLTPQTADENAAGAAVGRMVLDKVFHGDIEATSRGQMLATRTATEGSAGYVAMEVVTGTVSGHRGSFVFQHSGTMNRGASELVLTIVPDSGTDELTGISGRCRIIIESGKHSYELEYTLRAAK